MKAEKLILTSIVKGATQVRLWDCTSPISFGHPVRWVLERFPTGVRIRYLHGPGSVIRLDEQVLDGQELIQLPDSNIQIRLKRMRPIRAAYLDSNSTTLKNEMPILMAFSGVRRSVLNSLQVHTAYVAYCKGKPVFTVHNDNDGIRISLLANKLRLKKKGEPSVPGSAGGTWKISREELASVTIARDQYWWRFNLVSPSDHIPTTVPLEEKDRSFSKSIAAITALLLLFSVASHLMQKDEVVTKEVPIEVPKKEKIVIYRHEFAAQPAAQAAPAPAAPATPVQEITPPAQSVSRALPGKRAAPKAAGGQANAHRKVTDRAARLAKSQTKVLKEALGGAASLMKNIAAPGSSAKSFSGLFSANGPMVSQTDVKPGFAGSNVKVGKIGGTGMGGAGAGSAKSIGYGSGQHGSVSGQGASLVSDGIGGSTVDEGLTKDQVGAVIHAHMNEIRYCHEYAMLGNPGIQGKLVVAFGIDPSGHVEHSSVQSSTLLPDTSIEGCLLRRLVGWKFPRPRGGVHVNVSYPFLFKTLLRE